MGMMMAMADSQTASAKLRRRERMYLDYMEFFDKALCTVLLMRFAWSGNDR
jgi:hypothetical protein